MKEFYTVEEVAKMFEITTRTVYRLIKRNEISFIKVGKQIRFSQKHLDDFINKKEK